MEDFCVLPNIIDRQAKKYGSREALSFVNEKGEKLAAYSYSQFKEIVDAYARSFVAKGIKTGDICIVYSANRPEMLFIDFACYAIGAIPVSVYSTSSSDQVKYILNHSKPKLVFTGDAKQKSIVDQLLPECPWVMKSYNWDLGESPIGEVSEQDKESLQAQVEAMRSAVKPTDTATLIYTSGTTGEPKAADLPHSCFNCCMHIHEERLTMLSDKDTSLCFLPLCHIFEKGWTYVCIYMGMHVSINQNPREIAKTIRALRPTCMCSVPRFWEKAYAIINDKMQQRMFLLRWFAQAAIACGRKRNLEYARVGKKAPWYIELPYRFFDKKLLTPVKKVMGVDRGTIFPTAGAPIASNIVEFFRSIGVEMMVGYGLSETTATVTCFPEVGYVIGSVGTVMPHISIRIGLEGEIQVKGDTVMRCYYDNEQATSQAFTKDGWFRTGDAGYIDDEGALVLTERLKDLFKTSNGKYIAPQAIESRLGADKFIEQVAVVGESRSYVTALIVPAYDALKEFAKQKKIHYSSISELIANPEIVKMIGERIDKLQAGLPSFEQIKKFTLLPAAFTMETGELTNTLKIRRPVISVNYAKEIEAMYQ